MPLKDSLSSAFTAQYLACLWQGRKGYRHVREEKTSVPQAHSDLCIWTRRQNVQLIVCCCFNRYSCGMSSAQDRAECYLQCLLFGSTDGQYVVSGRIILLVLLCSPDSFVSFILSKQFTKERNLGNKFTERLIDFLFFFSSEHLLNPL